MDRRRASGVPALLRRLRWVNLGRLTALLAAGLLIASGGRGCRSEAPAGVLERSWRPSVPDKPRPAKSRRERPPAVRRPRRVARHHPVHTGRVRRPRAPATAPERGSSRPVPQPPTPPAPLHGEFTPDPGR